MGGERNASDQAQALYKIQQNNLNQEIVALWETSHGFTQGEAQELALRYAIIQRELWKTTDSRPVASTIIREQWNDAISEASKNNWQELKDAMQKHMQTYLDKETDEGRKRSQAVVSLVRKL